MRLFILITGIIEILAGLVFFLAPSLIPEFSGASELSSTLARMYGAAALSIGLFSMLFWKANDHTAIKKYFLPTIILFNLLVAVACVLGYLLSTMNPGAIALHGLNTLVFILFYFRA